MKKRIKKEEKRARMTKKIMEDMGDKGARRGGKHNVNFEDHVVFVFLSKSYKYIQHSQYQYQQLNGCCVPFGFSALKSETADIKICHLNYMWAGEASMKRQDTVFF